MSENKVFLVGLFVGIVIGAQIATIVSYLST